MRTLIFSMLLGIIMLPLGAGCGPKERDDHGHHRGKKESGGHGDEESPSGASFKAGLGIQLTDETSKILGLEIADVIEEPLAQVIPLNVQIFKAVHRLESLSVDHTGCEVHGSGFLPPDRTVLIKPKQEVQLLNSRNESFDGFVAAVLKPFAQGESEVIVGVTTVGSKLKDGEFVRASILVPRKESVTVIPRSALLRTVEGTFVYAVNGDAYYRTAVRVGSKTDTKVEVTDGLYAGDQVVTNPVETLWIIELLATKGGGHSH